MGFNILEHTIVPGHRVLDDDEVETVLSKYNIEKEKLSKIRMTDPTIKEISANPGDIIEITRTSETAGESLFYRLAIE
ncbi:MAG: DNA-directed RNA polymerase subunit H [Methanosarcinales archaeon]|nr:DNA-directed RNA polymerase subunit H [Methanosarcinales archaeon]MCK4651801.1 DNA-directed RNA polymerase subunit H [Methanosarcinales archaeon]MCK4812176.1 DNA-directed RNA polymerase subunit H [Methanosarcinales archaeon]